MKRSQARSLVAGLALLGLPAALITSLPAATSGSTSGSTSACTGALDTAAEIQAAMKNASPGTTILIAPGVYVGGSSSSGDPSGKGLFYSGRSGTASSPIILTSCDSQNPAILSGTGTNDGAYGLRLTGDYWEIRGVVVTQVQKGIVIDNGNHNLLTGIEVHRIGDEGVHFRDGSSYNTLDHSKIHDTGNYQSGFGEGAYVGSDYNASYEHVVVGNVIRYTDFAGDITAEHIDIKEGATGTIVEYCTFNGTGISGNNSADSFLDVKGVNSVIRHNQGARKGNGAVLDAFQVRTHGSGYPTGQNNAFHDNTVNLDAVPGYIVYATSSTSGTTAHDDVRVGGGNRYSSNVNPTVAVRPVTWGAVKALYRGSSP
ncbi:MAG: right-handed parallel beta-helix repeat-containing protein [Candidatus Eiseniibacteriota bacterium]